MEYLEWIRRGYTLIEPLSSSSSEFASEQRKYDRRSIGRVLIDGEEGDFVDNLKIGDLVVYDDSDSIDFTIESKNCSIVKNTDILAKIKEKDNG